MKTLLTASEQVRAQKAHELLEKFFEETDADEVTEAFALMLEHYILTAPVERVDLATMTSITTMVRRFLFKLELSYRVQKDSPRAVHVEENLKCTHN